MASVLHRSGLEDSSAQYQQATLLLRIADPVANPAELPWPRDYTTAANLVLGHLPGGLATSLSPIGEGDCCFAFRDRSRVVRVAKHAQAAAALRREARVLSDIADQLPVPVPRPAFHEPATGCAFSVHQEITGVVLTRERWERLPASIQEITASDMAQFLGALHSVPIATAPVCTVPALDRAGYAIWLREAATTGLYERLDDDDRQRLDNALSRWSLPSADASQPAVLLHCDIAPGHVLFNRSTGRLTGVIDFGDMALGDPARDFVFILEDFGPDMLAAVLRHYPGEAAETLLPRVRMWQLLEAVCWTVGRHADRQFADVGAGLAEITCGLEVLDVSQAR